MRLHLRSCLHCSLGLVLGSSLTMILALTGLLCPSSVHPDSGVFFLSPNSIISITENGKFVRRGVTSTSCVCGKQVNELQQSIESIVGKLLKFDSSPQTKGEVRAIQRILSGLLPETSSGSWQTKKYPTGKELAKSISRPSHNIANASQHNRTRARIWQSFSFREELLVAVVMIGHEPGIDRMLMIQDSWGLDVAQTVFYMSADLAREYEEDLKRLATVVQMDDESWLSSPMAVLRHLHNHYLDSYNWFLLAGNGSVYVRGQQLEEMLSCMNPEQAVYLGHPAVAVDKDGSPIHYCMGGPGIILSRAALHSLLATKGVCPELALIHSESHAHIWGDYDRELGRCIKRTIGISCANREQEVGCFLLALITTIST